MRRIAFFLFLIILLPFFLSAQEDIKGIGLINPPLIISETDGILGTNFIKFVDLDLYEAPHVYSGHCLVREQLDTENVLTSIIHSTDQNSSIKYPTSALVWVGYKMHSLQYFQEQAGFVQVQLDRKKYWLKIDKLKSFGFKYVSWKTYFHESESNNLTTNYNRLVAL